MESCEKNKIFEWIIKTISNVIAPTLEHANADSLSRALISQSTTTIDTKINQKVNQICHDKVLSLSTLETTVETNRTETNEKMSYKDSSKKQKG